MPSTSCTSNTANSFSFSDLRGADMETVAGKKVSFSFWFKIANADASYHNILRFSKSLLMTDRCNAILTLDINPSTAT